MKWLTFLLTASTATAATPIGGAAVQQAVITEQVRVAAPAAGSVDPFNRFFGSKKEMTLLELDVLRYQKHLAYQERLRNNRIKLHKIVSGKLTKTAGKTWYVFSGATPAGWDCSGLVRWTYEQVGVELEHRADAQADSGKKVKNPLPGDIVAFYHKGSDYSFHVGIYLGKGKMIHAYRKGTGTVIQPVKEVVKENWGARVTYTRILPQPTN